MTQDIMIGFLRGKVALIDAPHMFLDVQGVGYKIFVAKEVLASGLFTGAEIVLFTYTYVREDTLELFGFLHKEDLKLFEHLISVSGIGPKTAVNIFSVGSRSQILQAIISGDVSFFSGVPRLGKKNAQKIIIELKSKFGKGEDIDLSASDGVAHEEVIQALTAIGFSAREARTALQHISGGETAEEKIKLALKFLGK